MNRLAGRRAARLLAGSFGLLLLLTLLPSALRLALGAIRFSDYPPRGAVVLDAGDVVRQRGDGDCGIAALLTLLHRNGIAATYADLAARLPVEERAARGISLGGLARLGALFALPLDGYRLAGLGDAPAALPWIAHVRGAGAVLGHYVVVERITPHAVIVSDPAFGRLALPPAAFARIWSGYALVRPSLSSD
jgi:ABC-type bacteriocin/lantibiotic exporter with double-glycine peptidase domain